MAAITVHAQAFLVPLVGGSGTAGGGADNNPHNYALATVTFNSKDYNTQVSSDVYEVPGDISASVVTMSYQSTGGFENSGHWRATPIETTEGNGGWKGLGFAGATPNVDEAPILVWYYKLRLSSQFLTDMKNETSGYGDSGHKILDVFMWNAAGTARDNDTRQVIKFLHIGAAGAGTLVWSHLKGGAGNEFTSDSVNTQIDFFTLPDEWFDVWHVFDRTNEVTRSYIKRASDTDVQVVLERFSSPAGMYATSPDNPYVYTDNGFNSGEGQTGLWFFWDDIVLASSASRYVDIDSFRVGNGWILPVE